MAECIWCKAETDARFSLDMDLPSLPACNARCANTWLLLEEAKRKEKEMAPRTRQKWTPDEDAYLRKASAERLPRRDIGQYLGRSADAVTQRAVVLGIPSYTATTVRPGKCPGGHPLTKDKLGDWCTICLWVNENRDGK